jgi:hypothetical protein
MNKGGFVFSVLIKSRDWLLVALLAFGLNNCRAGHTLLDALGQASLPVPHLEWTQVPEWGSFDLVEGRVLHADPDSFAVALLVYVGGWWSKPSFDAPLTRIEADGSWSADYTTGGLDHEATRLAAFLVPADFVTPLAEGDASVPQALYAAALDSLVVEREAQVRTLAFAGLEWWVKAGAVRLGPGPNFFSDSHENVWVDAQGKLHLRVIQRGGRWYCAEIVSRRSFGYGTYVFAVENRVDTLDAQLVGGLFTWDDDAAFFHREIDIELSRWGLAQNDNAQFVVQPWQDPANIRRFELGALAPTTQVFSWRAGAVDFSSFEGSQWPPVNGQEPLYSWRFDGAAVPPPGDEKVRINLWLLEGKAPANGTGGELVVEAFKFLAD